MQPSSGRDGNQSPPQADALRSVTPVTRLKKHSVYCHFKNRLAFIIKPTLPRGQTRQTDLQTNRPLLSYLFLIVLNRFLHSLGLGAPQENIEVDELRVFLDQLPIGQARLK